MNFLAVAVLLLIFAELIVQRVHASHHDFTRGIPIARYVQASVLNRLEILCDDGLDDCLATVIWVWILMWFSTVYVVTY